MFPSLRLCVILGLLLGPIACGTQEPPLALACNPLSGGPGEDCLLPFPSSYYTRPDPDSVTGLRLDLPRSALPVSAQGQPLSPTPYNRRDGFSPVATLLVYFPGPVDGSSLPHPDDVTPSLRGDSHVQLLRYDTGERIPLFAELDQNVDLTTQDRQVLVLQPIVRLQPATRYVALVQGLRRPDGSPVPPLAGFVVLRDGLLDDASPRASERARFQEIFALLDRIGISRMDLQAAWDFTTASEGEVSGRLVRMRDGAWSFPQTGEAVHINQVTQHPAGMEDLLLDITGTFAVPSFLTEDLAGGLTLDPGGEPVIRGLGQFPLAIHVPECARTARLPLPILLYGHGTFNTADAEMSIPYQRQLINRLCMVQIGTDWLGRAQSDLPYLLQNVLTNWNNFSRVTDRLQQAHINQVTLAHLIKAGGLNALPSLQLDGKPIIDGKQLYYLGISEGGCQGPTLLSLSPDIDRAVLNVPCGFWSLFFWRSSDFHRLLPVLLNTYRDALERQVLMALSQLLWDYTDPANYAAHVLRDPLPGGTPKRILYQEGINDASVPNLTTRAMVRALGLALLQPRIESVYEVAEVASPQDSAYVQFDVGQEPRLGGDNIPPAETPVHEAIRRLEAVQQQIQDFLREGGQVVDTCQGRPCRFPLPQ